MKTMDSSLRRAVCARSLFLQSFWSFEGRQNLGFLFGLDPWLRRVYPDSEEYREAALRHLEHFNTQPFMASFTFGVVGALEEKRARASQAQRPAIEKRIRQLKSSLGASLAAVGDSFFWGALKPASAALTLLVWLALWTVGVPYALFLGVVFCAAAFNAPALWVRWEGLRLGYGSQEKLPAELKKLRWQSKTRWVRGVGLAAAVVLALSALLVPPIEGTVSWWNVVLLAAALGARALGLSTPRIYGCAVVLFAGGALLGL